MKGVVGLLLLLSGPAAVAQDPVAEQAYQCGGCHDIPGQSPMPRLKGQRADYFVKRIGEFHNPASQTPHATYFMFDTAGSLGDAKTRALAAYFAAQPAAPARPAGKDAVLGEAFYHGAGGCQACHGPQGEGGQAAPRIAGQHNIYLQNQLTAFSLSVRYHPDMVGHSLKLTPAQITGLVAWLGGDG